MVDDGPGRTGRRFLAFTCFALMLGTSAAAWAQTSEAVDPSALRVCADPGNLPFSNQAGKGFENKIAELLAAELDLPVRYTWFPQATGFVRNTLMARRCDLVIGISLGFELLQNSNPYYRSSYSMIYRADAGHDFTSLDDPKLKDLRIGIVAGTPPASLMAKHGLLGRARPYHLVADTRFDQPAKRMVQDLAAGEIDVGLLWGPLAGYYGKQQSVALRVVPLKSNPDEVKMDYRITMGMRFNEPNWKRKINGLIRRKQAAINAILHDYGVPLLDGRGEVIPP